MARHHLMTSIKNEAIYMLEWVAHHKALGFDEIFVAANDCNDGTPALLRKLDANGFLKFTRNKCAPDQIPQHEGYKVLRERFDVDACDWLMVLDVDEFLYVGVGDGTVKDLTERASDDVDVIALNGLNFGTGDAPKPGDLVTKRFQYRLPERHMTNRSIKSITRNPERFKAAHNHSMVQPSPDQNLIAMRADGTTFDIPEKTKLWKVLRHTPLDQVTHEMAHYNHYSVKSPEEYMFRQQRGRGAVAPTSTDAQRHSDEYFLKRAGGDVLDDRLSKYDVQTRHWLNKMLAVPAIKAKQAEVEVTFFERLDGLLAKDKG